ncbi:MAG: hypothetical protein GF364_22105 [Candidatus Lokiarchaeota archaeon]|nr:hypothetical protein [Candidatus Lokiarchaeota archaeon]
MSGKTIRSVKSQHGQQRDTKLVKLLRYIAWTNAVLLVGVFGLILTQALVLGDYDGIMTGIYAEFSINKLGLAIIFASHSGLCFGTAAQIKETPARKQIAFRNLIISSAMISVIAICAMGFGFPIPW